MGVRSKVQALQAILYVSKSELISSASAHGVREIVEFSRRWNRAVGITGALMSTERCFMQFIEGPRFAIADMLAKLRADGRHSHMDILLDADVDQRRFGDWSLAYSGPDMFLDYDLTPLLRTQSGTARERTAEKLVERLQAMA